MEPWGPDAELAKLRSAAEAVVSQFTDVDSLLNREDLSPDMRGRLQSQAEQLRSQAIAAEDAYNSAAERHPLNVYRKIVSDSEDVMPPELSAWGRLASNPSFLRAAPKDDEQRAMDARHAFLLKRVSEAANRGDTQDPMHWDNYSGPHSGDMSRLAGISAGMGEQDYKNLESPYSHRQLFGDGRGDWSTDAGQLVGDALEIPGNTVWLGAKAAGNLASPLIAAGNQFARGDFSGAARAAVRTPLAALNPAYDLGGPGGEYDWRDASGPVAATAATVLPWMASFGVRSPTATVNSIRSLSRSPEARDLLQRAARRHHPDVGGTDAAMKAANAAYERGDINTLMQMAR